MDSSSRLPGGDFVTGHRWARIVGTVIAVLTLAIPTAVVAYYSSSDLGVPAVLDGEPAPEFAERE